MTGMSDRVCVDLCSLMKPEDYFLFSHSQATLPPGLSQLTLTLGTLRSLHREEQVVVGFGFINVIRTYNYFEITYYASAIKTMFGFGTSIMS
uniref:Putative 3-dehydroquinate synthase n=1 Tax=Helianthus annuus TaxID=4232 RepID=A0A251VBZ2_HELAN